MDEIIELKLVRLYTYSWTASSVTLSSKTKRWIINYPLAMCLYREDEKSPWSITSWVFKGLFRTGPTLTSTPICTRHEERRTGKSAWTVIQKDPVPHSISYHNYPEKFSLHVVLFFSRSKSIYRLEHWFYKNSTQLET